MTPEEKRNIIRGLVRYGARWVTMDKKVEFDRRYREKLEQGLVMFQGEWMPIEEKLRRTSPPAPAAGPDRTPNITIHNAYHYTDNRTFRSARTEHRHVHIEGVPPADASRQVTAGQPRYPLPAPSDEEEPLYLEGPDDGQDLK